MYKLFAFFFKETKYTEVDNIILTEKKNLPSKPEEFNLVS